MLYYLLKYPDITKINFKKAREILGTIDDRTIEKHIKKCDKIIKKANVDIAEILTLMSNVCQLPDMPIGASPLDLLKQLIFEAAKGKSKMHGGLPKPISEIIIIHNVYSFETVRKSSLNSPLKPPLSYVLRFFLLNDTS